MEPTQEKTKQFLYINSTMNPLVKVEDAIILQSIINPRTGKPYKGMILEGVAAYLGEDYVNNNNRLYDEKNYLEFVAIIKKQIFSPKGLYGELEHPKKGYAIDSNNVSHKLLDIWYNQETKCVMIRILVMNTPTGKIIQEIIETNGQIAISARAAGDSAKNSKGQEVATVKMIVTFDCVYHPGFEMANLSLVNLNESYNFKLNSDNQNYVGFGIKLFESALPKMDDFYTEYLNSDSKNNFLTWLSSSKYEELNESEKDSQQQKKQQKLQNNQTNDEDEVEDELSNATDKDLSEAKTKFFQQVQSSQNKLKYKKQGKSFYDNSAGFMDNDLSGGLD